jgi:hypothetical protein
VLKKTRLVPLIDTACVNGLAFRVLLSFLASDTLADFIHKENQNV